MPFWATIFAVSASVNPATALAGRDRMVARMTPRKPVALRTIAGRETAQQEQGAAGDLHDAEGGDHQEHRAQLGGERALDQERRGDQSGAEEREERRGGDGAPAHAVERGSREREREGDRERREQRQDVARELGVRDREDHVHREEPRREERRQVAVLLPPRSEEGEQRRPREHPDDDHRRVEVLVVEVGVLGRQDAVPVVVDEELPGERPAVGQRGVEVPGRRNDEEDEPPGVEQERPQRVAAPGHEQEGRDREQLDDDADRAPSRARRGRPPSRTGRGIPPASPRTTGRTPTCSRRSAR